MSGSISRVMPKGADQLRVPLRSREPAQHRIDRLHQLGVALAHHQGVAAPVPLTIHHRIADRVGDLDDIRPQFPRKVVYPSFLIIARRTASAGVCYSISHSAA